jgi:hypothetical protein
LAIETDCAGGDEVVTAGAITAARFPYINVFAIGSVPVRNSGRARFANQDPGVGDGDASLVNENKVLRPGTGSQSARHFPGVSQLNN